MALPDPVRERMRLAGENGLAEGMAIARELLEQVRDKVAGVCLMPIVWPVRRCGGAGGLHSTIVPFEESGKGGPRPEGLGILQGRTSCAPTCVRLRRTHAGEQRFLPLKGI